MNISTQYTRSVLHSESVTDLVVHDIHRFYITDNVGKFLLATGVDTPRSRFKRYIQLYYSEIHSAVATIGRKRRRGGWNNEARLWTFSPSGTKLWFSRDEATVLHFTVQSSIPPALFPSLHVLLLCYVVEFQQHGRNAAETGMLGLLHLRASHGAVYLAAHSSSRLDLSKGNTVMEHWLSWFVRLLHLSSCFFVGELRHCYADLLTSFILTMIK